MSTNEEIKYFNPYIPQEIYSDSPSPSSGANPYGGSFWQYSRGDNGEEIRRIQERTKALTKLSKGDRNHPPNARPPNLPLRLSNKENQVPSRSIISSSHGESIFTIYSDTTESAPTSPLVLKDRRSTKVNFSRGQGGCWDSAWPFFRFVDIVKKSLNSLNMLFALQNSFDTYVRKNALVISSQHRSILFGNLSTIVSITQLLMGRLEKMDGQYVTAIDDYLTRALRVYPSYVEHGPEREILVGEMETKKNTLTEWFQSVRNLLQLNGFSSLKQALESPIANLDELLRFLEENMKVAGVPAPEIGRIAELTSKLREVVEFKIMDSTLKAPFNLYQVPMTWKRRHRKKWKEISNSPPENQVIWYLKDELARERVAYRKLLQLIQEDSVKSIEMLLQSSARVASVLDKFSDLPGEGSSPVQELTPRTELFQRNSIHSVYQLYDEKNKQQKEDVAVNLLKFQASIRSHDQQLEEYYKLAVRMQRMTDADAKVRLIRQLWDFLRLFRDYVGTLLGESIGLLHDTLLALLGTSAPEIATCSQIVQDFQVMKYTNKQILADQGADVKLVSGKLGKTKATQKIINMM